jgi:hypothetical protein
MAINIRKDGSLFLSGVVTAYNTVVDAGLTSQVHKDKTSQQNGTDLVPSSTPLLITAITMTTDGYYTAANNIQGVLMAHFADDSAHLIADIVNVDFDGYARASSAATAYALVNAIKLNYNNHGTETSVHLNNDSSHDITSPDANSEASLVTLLAELRTDINAHIADAGLTQRYQLVPA